MNSSGHCVLSYTACGRVLFGSRVAKRALPLIGHTQTQPQTLPRGDMHSDPFGVITSGHREIERAHPLLGDSALSYNPVSIGDMIVSSLFHPEDPAACTFDRRIALGTKKLWRLKPLRTKPTLGSYLEYPPKYCLLEWSVHLGSAKKKATERERQGPERRTANG